MQIARTYEVITRASRLSRFISCALRSEDKCDILEQICNAFVLPSLAREHFFIYIYSFFIFPHKLKNYLAFAISFRDSPGFLRCVIALTRNLQSTQNIKLAGKLLVGVSIYREAETIYDITITDGSR